MLLWLDRQPEVAHFVSQPVRLRWGARSQHVPDLLSKARGGQVTLWDARRPSGKTRPSWPPGTDLGPHPRCCGAGSC